MIYVGALLASRLVASVLLGEVAAGAACLCNVVALGVDLRASCSVALSGDGFCLIG